MKLTHWPNRLGFDLCFEHDTPAGTGADEKLVEVWDKGKATGLRTFYKGEAEKWLEVSIPFEKVRDGDGSLFRTLFFLTDKYGASCWGS
jgi:hypothetical protein